MRDPFLVVIGVSEGNCFALQLVLQAVRCSAVGLLDVQRHLQCGDALAVAELVQVFCSATLAVATFSLALKQTTL